MVSVPTALNQVAISRLSFGKRKVHRMNLASVKRITTGLAIGAVAVLAGCAATPPGPGEGDAYLKDARGVVVRNSTGLCWRTSYWTPAAATCECDKDILPKEKCEPPAPMAATPTPPPVPAPKMMPEKITFSADVLFDFDKATLKPEGKQALDSFVGKLGGVAYEVIVSVGHTDPIGPDAYNKKLSVRRAESVKAYLVSKGIPANKVYTDGKGEADLVVKPADCKGKTGKALIQCYQPNRRVEVEVAGSRK
jgi:OOP family OmpA-OmpF porin